MASNDLWPISCQLLLFTSDCSCVVHTQPSACVHYNEQIFTLKYDSILYYVYAKQGWPKLSHLILCSTLGGVRLECLQSMPPCECKAQPLKVPLWPLCSLQVQKPVELGMYG